MFLAFANAALTASAVAQSPLPTLTPPAVNLAWDAETNLMVSGYKIHIGYASQTYVASLDVSNNTSGSLSGLQPGTNYFLAVTSYAADGTESVPSWELVISVLPSFFNGNQVLNTNGVRSLQFPDGNSFGYFGFAGYPWIYHVDMGYEYVFAIADPAGGVVLYDNSSQSYWYTNPSIFPIMYDFNLNSWLYYYPDSNNPGHYTSNPRYFWNINTGSVISK